MLEETTPRPRGPRITVPFASDTEYGQVARKARSEGVSVAAYLRDLGLGAELSPNARVIRELIGLESRVEERYAPAQPQYQREYAEILIAITEAISRIAAAPAA